MRIVFMGTPDIAEAALVELLRSGDEVVGVYTRPDKPVGRKQVLTAPPVKVRAEENGIPVFQPKTLRTETAAADLAALRPDLVVVVAYGAILTPEVLAVPKYGCINMHVSLLPAYRGAAPIQWAVINGEKKTGVTIMQMDEGVDTGPILAQREVEIGPDATSGEVFDEISRIGSRFLAETVDKLRLGKLTPRPQHGESSQAPQLKKEMARLDFRREALHLHNLVRGCNPWPLAWFLHGGKRIKVTASRTADGEGRPGEILSLNPLTIACGRPVGFDTTAGALVLETVTPEGARSMLGSEWAAGRRFKAGEVLAFEE